LFEAGIDNINLVAVVEEAYRDAPAMKSIIFQGEDNYG
jgi:hypothetical protein